MEVQLVYNLVQTIYFPVIVASDQDFAVAADWTPAGADCNISIDGGTYTQAANTIAFVSGSPICSLALTAAETRGSKISIVVSATEIEDQFIACTTQLSGQIEASKGIIIGEVENATFTPTTSQWEGHRLSPNLTEETTADHYNGRLVLWTSGVLLGQMSDITDYVLANSLEKFTVTAMTEAPGNDDRYVIL